jgi:hypothetical protein
MGMFDYVVCEWPLKCGKFDKHGFQTKDLENCLFVFRISKSGRMMRERYKLLTVPKSKQNKWGLPLFSKKRLGWKDMKFHGVLNFYSADKLGRWHEHFARFTDGTLVKMDCHKEQTPRPGDAREEKNAGN